MAEERRAKLRRLDEFRRRVPHVSASALAAICQAIDADGMPELHDRAAMRAARDQVVASETPYGPVIQTIALERTEHPFEIAHPLAMLWHCFKSFDAWRALMVEKHRQRPSSPERPWSLVLYSDEVTPGALLATQPTRKSQAIYYSFLELGHVALARRGVALCNGASELLRGKGRWRHGTSCRGDLEVALPSARR